MTRGGRPDSSQSPEEKSLEPNVREGRTGARRLKGEEKASLRGEEEEDTSEIGYRCISLAWISILWLGFSLLSIQEIYGLFFNILYTLRCDCKSSFTFRQIRAVDYMSYSSITLTFTDIDAVCRSMSHYIASCWSIWISEECLRIRLNLIGYYDSAVIEVS
jgi:hypothetical protein